MFIGPKRSAAKAIESPAGDHTGEAAWKLAGVSANASPPAVGAIQI
jgi:hypothetical protein